MRPLIVDLGREYRGGQHQALLLARGLVSRGHLPQLITIADSTLAQKATEAGVEVIGVSCNYRRIAAAIQIRRLVHEDRIDIVHANEPHGLTAAWLARAHRSTSVIISRRIALPLSQGVISLARYRAAARVIAVSRFVQQSVVESGVPVDRVEVIYDGVEIPPGISETERYEHRTALGIPVGTRCIGNVAALVPEKGHVLLLRAFARLQKTSLTDAPACHLLLVGEGPEKINLQRLARELGITGNVTFLGNSANLHAVLSAIDLFVFPSHEEPLGSALLLAMAHKLPVIAFARGGIPEIIYDGLDGFLVNDLDSEALAAAIRRAFANPVEQRSISEAARTTIVNHFSVDRMTEATLAMYETVLAERQ